jgi:uncharacterized protein
LPHRSRTPSEGDAQPLQSEVVDELSRPEIHGGTPVTRIDTPISHIFIAGPRTYKLKRAVTRNFVDYSTLEKRKVLCEREIEVNTGSAPGLYKGVVPIVRTSSGIRIGGHGEAVDYVVEMATFDPDQAFDRLAENGKLSRNDIVELADIVAGLHASATPAPRYGGSQAFAATIRQVCEEIRASKAGGRLANETDAWRHKADAAWSACERQLDARRRYGYVRRCHGDLHLGNICLFEGRPTPFDAIEFSEEIASVDVLYDLAFTVMDLLYRDLAGHANALLSRYLNITRDYSGLRLMPLFVSLRAAVRAMVAASREDASKDGATEARARLEFAAGVLGREQDLFLIAVGGLSGSGKSTLAMKLAPQIPGLFGAVVIRSDVCRKRLFGVPAEAPLPEDAYAPEISERVYRTMMRDAGRALRSGTSVILDATFIEGDDAKSLERLAARSDARFAGLWLSLELRELQERIRQRGKDASDATSDVAASQWKRVRRDSAWVQIDASHCVDEVVAAARRALGL